MTAAEVFDRLQIDSAAIAEICARWEVTELGVFGSAARGELRPDSDVDVLVEFLPGADLGPWLFKFRQLQSDLESLLGRPVDVVEKGALKNPIRRRSILEDLTVLYAA